MRNDRGTMRPMASWRDSASQLAQDDLDGLLNSALPFAQQMLDERGEFFPYGVALSAAGEARMVAGDPGQGEHPRSQDVLRTIVEGLRRERDNLRAVALVADVRMADSDAVRVELEHSEGPTMAVLLPYTKKRLRRTVEFGNLAATAAAPSVWS